MVLFLSGISIQPYGFPAQLSGTAESSLINTPSRIEVTSRIRTSQVVARGGHYPNRNRVGVVNRRGADELGPSHDGMHVVRVQRASRYESHLFPSAQTADRRMPISVWHRVMISHRSRPLRLLLHDRSEH